MNALQLTRWQFFTQRNFVADFLQAKCDFTAKTAVFSFLSPFGGLGGRTMIIFLRLIGKRVADFLLGLVLTELFSLGVTADSLRANIDWKSAISLQRGQSVPKFQVEGVATTDHSFSQKTTLYDLSCGIKIRIDFLSFCHNPRVWQTDGQTPFTRLDRPAFNAAGWKSPT